MAHIMNRLAVVLALLASTVFLLSAPQVGAVGANTAKADPDDPAEIEAFVDNFWAENMQPLEVPGAVFVLVKDSRILFAKGYGVADIDEGKPVDPGTTLFAIGSVSKAITASAVMQLVERGQLRLDEPVDNYLTSLEVGERCLQPVTTHHLLTHTAGFDERVMGAFVTAADQLIPLAEYVASELPPCIRPPGQEMSYCNHCYGLAGLLVQEIANLPFEQYVEDNIFQPLEMRHSSFRQPLPAELDGLRATGYIFTPEIQPAPYVYGHFFPTGSAWATGEDMGSFIIGHLQGGLPGGEPILDKQTLALMHRRQFSQDPRLEGWTYGFFEHMENGQRLIGKDGDVPGFSSSLYLMPEQDLGFFLAYNAAVSARREFMDPRMVFPSHFLQHYFPANETLLPANPSGDASRLSGFYRWSRFGHTSIDKIISPLSLLQWQISANPDGSITLDYPSLLGGPTSRFAEVEPGLFQDQANGSYLTFEEDSRGRVTHVYTKVTEEGVLERVAWYETQTFQAVILIFIILVFGSVLVAGLARAARRALRGRRDQQPVQSSGGGYLRLAPWLSGILSGLNLLFLAVLVVTVLESMTVRAPQVPAYMVGLLVIPLITAVLTLAMLALTLLVWTYHYGSLLRRVHYTLATLAGLAFVWFAAYWNLLGFKL